MYQNIEPASLTMKSVSQRMAKKRSVQTTKEREDMNRLAKNRGISSTIKRLFALIIAISAAFAVVTPASAAGVDNTCQSCQTDIDRVMSQSTVVAGKEASQDIGDVMRAVKSGHINLHGTVGDLSQSEAVVYRFAQNGDSIDVVTIPIHGSYSLSSNLSATVTEQGKLLQYNETLVDENADGNFRTVNYTDGKLTQQQNTSIRYRTDNELRKEITAKAPMLASTKKLSPKACASIVFGVSGGLAALIASVCTGACAATIIAVGAPACLACVGMFVAVSGGSLTGFMNCLNK